MTDAGAIRNRTPTGWMASPRDRAATGAGSWSGFIGEWVRTIVCHRRRRAAREEYAADMRRIPGVTLKDGTGVPALGLGTWRMGEARATRAAEVRALVHGIELGLALVDTAEMYGDGGAEEVVGDAIAGRRDRVFVVSKVLPQNAGRRATITACERSLARLRTDRLDLYLLHWRGGIPLVETVEAFERLVRDGKIRRWGVSNFDVGDLHDLARTGHHEACVANQILYHLAQRGPEAGVLRGMAHDQIVAMAYSPFDQGRLLESKPLAAIARDAGTTAPTLAIAWLLTRPEVIAVPKAARIGHVDAIRAAIDFDLDPRVLEKLDAAFPPPQRPTPLAML